MEMQKVNSDDKYIYMLNVTKKMDEVKKKDISNPKTQQNGTGPQTKKMRSNTKLYIVLGLGVILIIVGITVGVLWGTIVDYIYKNELTLTPTSKSFEMWNENPIPVFLSFYMFNLSNAVEFLQGRKPKFTEHGPYVFSEKFNKTDKVWNDNGTVTFHRRRYWTFVPELSKKGVSLSDEITNLNPIVVTLGNIVRFQKPLLRKFASFLMKAVKENVVITKSVSQLIFDGYEDKLLEIARKLNITTLPYDKFGWFYGRNESDTYEGTYNIKTGKNSISEIGELVEWNYTNKTIYNNGKCSKIKGTVGDLWHPFTANESSRLSVFSSDICTSIDLVYGNTTELLGIYGTKFISHENIFDNGTNDPSRKCYCSNVECQPSGTLNVSLCKFGAPAFISLPHFYLADPSYGEKIEGMNPNKVLHETHVVLDPVMGVPMKVKAQLQLNLLVRQDDEIEPFKKINDTFVPMLWFSQTAELTSQYATLVKIIHILPLLGHATFYGIGAIGALLVFIAVFVSLRAKWREEENQNLLSNDRDNNSVITNDG
ncbi:protein croquemort-like isoform X2 [Leptopilina boulardi]|uniref:protein croquemort-like isoform X2 n=1 Tax=Leptopilina boulardi TaxID=63433 RepID=UPI0021F54EF7|nr:protein croquemort-like isoform X2 [Leptopilina boulardi]